MNGSSNGFLESIPLKAILAGIVTFLGLYFAFPEYILNVRPQIEKAIGANTLSFIEGAISGSIIIIILLKFLAERHKKHQPKKEENKAVKWQP